VVIYEVNIRVEKERAFDYAEWLRIHVDEILQLGCFISAEIFVRSPEDEGEASDEGLYSHFTVHYRARDRQEVERYLKDFSPEMRRRFTERFADQVKIYRRVLSRIRVDHMQSSDVDLRLQNEELDREISI
jgi:hypothetical protein